MRVKPRGGRHDHDGPRNDRRAHPSAVGTRGGPGDDVPPIPHPSGRGRARRSSQTGKPPATSVADRLLSSARGTADGDVGGETKNKPGLDDFFGEIGVLEEERVRAATVTATSPMKLVVITGRDLRALSRDMPEVIDKLRSACYDRVRGTL
jgi:hypothetical protein